MKKINWNLVMNSVAILVCVSGFAKTVGSDGNLAFKFVVLGMVAFTNLLHNYGK